ncbi:uncharacterized protein [Linepithema humile]|uniref:uncharacterized protein n=1 Tax=Linepithema humile TaxID=83485 RepID=UPI00351EF3AD
MRQRSPVTPLSRLQLSIFVPINLLRTATGNDASSYLRREPHKRDPAVRTLSVFVKTSSLPSLRSMSHGTFDHVEEPASGSDGGTRHDESARFVEGLRRWVSVLSMQARWWPHPSSSVRRDKGSCAAGGRFYILKRFKREPCHYRSRQKTARGYHAFRRRLRESRRIARVVSL